MSVQLFNRALLPVGFVMLPVPADVITYNGVVYVARDGRFVEATHVVIS